MLQTVCQVVSGGHFKKLFEWHFDKKRVLRRESFSKRRKWEQTKSIVSDRLFLHELGIEDDFEFLNLFYPCFEQHIPNIVREFYDILVQYISLAHSGMDGVGFRETRVGLLEILEKSGYCGIVLSDAIDLFENKIMEQHYDRKKG